jgi:hypothetical protein
MSFRVDDDTFLCLNFDEQLASHPALDASGNQVSIPRNSVSSVASAAGPYTGKRARRVTAGAFFYTASLNFDPRPNFRGDCTVQLAFKPRLISSQPNHRALFMHSSGASHYFFAWWNPSDANGISLTYNGSQAGPNTAGSTQEEFATGLKPSEDTWYVLTMRKTVTSGTTDANKLNTIDVWLTPVAGSINSATPDFSRTNVLNPNVTTGTFFYAVGNWGGPSNLWSSIADYSGLRCVKRALSAADVETSFNLWKGSSGDVTKPTVTNFLPAPGGALQKTQPISFEVSDVGGLRRVMVVAAYPSKGLEEVVHDGTSWGPQYSVAPNFRGEMEHGYAFTILRRGGWPAPPTLRTYAVDTSGNEAD